ncbi:MAG: hypothetical protein AAGF94_08680 [Pseudomonadota bacterium]
MNVSYIRRTPVKFFTIALLTAAAWLQPNSAPAAPITFEHLMTSRGSTSPIIVDYLGRGIETQSVKITAQGDTDDRITPVIPMAPGSFLIPHTKAQFEFTDTSNNTTTLQIDITPGIFATGTTSFDGVVGFAVVLNGAFQRELIEGPGSSALLNWDMTTSVSGITGTNDSFINWTVSPFVTTDSGNASIRVGNYHVANSNFTATVEANPGAAPVPLPFGIGLLGAALVVLGGLRTLPQRRQQRPKGYRHGFVST